MAKKSDIRGVVICLLGIIVTAGAGIGFFAGLMKVINHSPDANLGRTIAAGVFCLFISAGPISYIASRYKDSE